jgi:hypothetical protein
LQSSQNAEHRVRLDLEADLIPLLTQKVTRYSDYTKGWTTEVLFPVGVEKGIFPLRYRIQTGSEADPIGTVVFFPWG